MSSDISKLPPPWPNAAQALSRVASDPHLREQVRQASENAPIRSDFKSGSASDDKSVKASSEATDGIDRKLDINI